MASDLSSKSVLVTGAAGCIGAWVVKGLQEIGAKPVVYDLSEDRRRLNLIMDNAESVDWITGDITDYKQLKQTIENKQISAIIHLAALQVPFAKANPILGTNVNVMGTTHIFEAARQCGIDRIAYASSIAAPAMGENSYLDTLYGAHKICNEQMAKVYWQDWQVPSVCIRPGVIYGPGRDQGMSAAPTLGVLAAYAGRTYDIPFIGPVSYVHVEDAARRFIGAIARETEGAEVFNMNGVVVDMERVLSDMNIVLPYNGVTASGSALPFPANPDDGLLDSFVGARPHRSFLDGLSGTVDMFRLASQRQALNEHAIRQLLG